MRGTRTFVLVEALWGLRMWNENWRIRVQLPHKLNDSVADFATAQLVRKPEKYLITYFNIGIIVGTVPCQMIQLRYIRPSIWIPSCELAWSSLVIAEAGAKDVKIGCIIFSPLGDSKTHASRLYVLRFFIGFFESCSFPGYSALLGSWYAQGQLGKRVALFEQAVPSLACLRPICKQLCIKVSMVVVGCQVGDGCSSLTLLSVSQLLFGVSGQFRICLTIQGHFILPKR